MYWTDGLITSGAIAKQHPEWLILTKDGNHSHMAGGFAVLCPAVPEVRQYYESLTKRFIQGWGFDGNKLDFSYTVPPCYNPTHHDKSPQDSIRAVGDIYRAIFQTTLNLSPRAPQWNCVDCERVAFALRITRLGRITAL